MVDARGVVEDAENMKENMKRIKAEAAKKENIKEGDVETKGDIKEKAAGVKDAAAQKTVDLKKKAGEVKETVVSKTDDIKDDATTKKEDLQEDMGKKKNQAEKILNDIISGIKDKQEEFGKTISDYKTALQKPLTDVLDTESSLIIKIDLPGVDKGDIDLGITEDSVEIKAVFEEEIDNENIKYLQKERSHGKTIRSITLPVMIKTEEVKAKFDGSVLTIELPKLNKEVHKVDIN
jgi:HSP20 family protein